MRNRKIIKIVAAIAVAAAAFAILLGRPSKEDVQQILQDELSENIASSAGENRVLKSVAENAIIEVESVSWGIQKVDATCTVSNYDIAAAFAAMTADDSEMTYDEYEQQFMVCLSEQPRIEHQETFTLNKIRGSYTVVFTNAQLDHLMGGFLTYIGEQHENS